MRYVVSNQIFRSYSIPIFNGAVYPSSKKIDFQSSYEKATIAWLAVLSGANVLLYYGSAYGELAWSPIQVILDGDVAGMIGRFVEGVEVSDDTLPISQ